MPVTRLFSYQQWAGLKLQVLKFKSVESYKNRKTSIRGEKTESQKDYLGMIWLKYITWIRPLISFVLKHLVWQQPKQVRKTERGSDLPLLICGGECLEWSEGSERRSGDRERLLLFLSWDRLEWSEATEWMSEISNTKIEWFHTITGVCYSIPSKVSLSGYSIFP